MRKAYVFLSLVAVSVAVAMRVGAQTQPNTIARIITIKVKPDQSTQWEGALKRLEAWEHQQNLPGTTYVWSVISGEHSGDYVLGTFGHNWKDFDAMDLQRDKVGVGKEIGETVEPYTESVTFSYYAFQPDLAVC